MTLARRRNLIIQVVWRRLRRALHEAFADGRNEFALHAPDAVGDRGFWRHGDGRVALVESPYAEPDFALSDADLPEVTLRDVGGELGGKSQERVRQIEARALRKLRHPSRAKQLEDFLPARRRFA